jgi:hypothetical protein
MPTMLIDGYRLCIRRHDKNTVQVELEARAQSKHDETRDVYNVPVLLALRC